MYKYSLFIVDCIVQLIIFFYLFSVQCTSFFLKYLSWLLICFYVQFVHEWENSFDFWNICMDLDLSVDIFLLFINYSLHEYIKLCWISLHQNPRNIFVNWFGVYSVHFLKTVYEDFLYYRTVQGSSSTAFRTQLSLRKNEK